LPGSGGRIHLDTLVAARHRNDPGPGPSSRRDHGRGWPAASHLAERLPYQKAIWHGFVTIAAAIHFFAVLTLVRS
jgi:predicted membrane channel-forming protein YqfA (hemolysin III family)